MQKSYPLIARFDGAKFASRYGLSGIRGDFYASDGQLFIQEGLVLSDDPPIQETIDSGPTKREILRSTPTKPVTVQDLIDLGIL